MNRFVTLAILFLLSSPALGVGQEKKRPKVVFLFTDDQRADTIAALGNKHIKTPNLDKLVQRGTAFTRAYCMGAMQGAVCITKSPTWQVSPSNANKRDRIAEIHPASVRTQVP